MTNVSSSSYDMHVSSSSQVSHMTKAEASLKHLILEACNIVTIAIPPALPAGTYMYPPTHTCPIELKHLISEAYTS
jgi:hypothetical protein